MRRFSAGSRVRLGGAVLCATVLLNAQIYVSKLSLFETYLKGPNEAILFQFRDGNIFIYTSETEGAVTVDPARLIDDLVGVKGKQLSELIQVTHNHFSDRTFSKADLEFCRYLEERGFTGAFCIYHTQSKTVEIKKTGET
jgi:hypothetical protein